MSNPYASDPGAEFPKPGMHANPAPHGVLPYQALKPLYDAKGWLMLTAWFLIVIGVIYCITIIGYNYRVASALDGFSAQSGFRIAEEWLRTTGPNGHPAGN